MTYPAPGAASSTSLPDLKAALTAPFWAASRRHVLMAQRCDDCADVRFPPLEICPACWSSNQSWAEIAPTGTVWSFVVYHRAFDSAMEREVPYVVGRVVTDDGPVFVVRLDIAPSDAKVGMRVTAAWNDLTESVTLLRFAAVD